MTSTMEKADDTTKADDKSAHQKELEQQLADLEGDGVEAEAVPADTSAELERVKHIVGSHLGIDMRSPGQVKQSQIEAIQAEIELEQQQAEEAKQAEEAAQAEADQAEAEAQAGTPEKKSARSSGK